MTTKTGLSLDDIEKQVSAADAVDLEPFLPNGEPSGITLLVRSDQNPVVVAGIDALMNARRRKELLTEAKARASRPGEQFITSEEDGEHVRKLTAVRLAGWKGLDDPFTPENAVRLLKLAPTFISQILNKAAELGSFTTTSPKG